MHYLCPIVFCIMLYSYSNVLHSLCQHFSYVMHYCVKVFSLQCILYANVFPMQSIICVEVLFVEYTHLMSNSFVICTLLSPRFSLSHTPCFPLWWELILYDNFPLIHFSPVLLCIRDFLLGVIFIIGFEGLLCFFSTRYWSPKPITLWILPHLPLVRNPTKRLNPLQIFSF